MQAGQHVLVLGASGGLGSFAVQVAAALGAEVTGVASAAKLDLSVVRWKMEAPKTLVTKVMGLFSSMDEMVGPDFEKGLTRLEADAERP